MKTKLKIGGMSLPNSISFIGPTKKVKINTKTDEISDENVLNNKFIDAIRKIPLVRGPIILLRQLWTIDKKIGPFIVLVLSIGLLMPILSYFPSCTDATNNFTLWFGYVLLACELIAVIWVIHKYWGNILGYIRSMKENHGAEHKTLWCYQKGLKLTVKNIREQPKEHPNCGGTILVWYIILMFLLQSIPFYSLICLSLSVEMLLLAEKFYILFIPSYFFQKLTVKEPNDDIIRKAIRAFNILLRLEER